MRSCLFCLCLALASTSCIFFVDLDPLSSSGGSTAPDAGVSDAGADGAPDTQSDAAARFCDQFGSDVVCEDFDRGRSNPAITWPIDALGGETKIVTDAPAVSSPGALWVSLRKGSAPNIKQFVTVNAPRAGTKVAARFFVRPIDLDYIIIANVQCRTRGDTWDGLSFFLAPDGTVDLAHGYDKGREEIGVAPQGVYSEIALTMTVGSSLNGQVSVGSGPGKPFDRPVACPNGAPQRIQIGIEGAGGKPTTAFDNLVYEVAP